MLILSEQHKEKSSVYRKLPILSTLDWMNFYSYPNCVICKEPLQQDMQVDEQNEQQQPIKKAINIYSTSSYTFGEKLTRFSTVRHHSHSGYVYKSLKTGEMIQGNTFLGKLYIYTYIIAYFYDSISFLQVQLIIHAI